MGRPEQLKLDAKTVRRLVIRKSCEAILRGETAYFYQKSEVDAVVNAIAMPLVIKRVPDDFGETFCWEIRLKEGT